MELWLNALFSWPKNIQCFDSWRPDSLRKKQRVDLFRVFQYTYNTFTSIYLGSFEEIQPTLPSYEYKLLGIFVVSDLSQWSGIRLDIALLWLGLVLILVHSHMHSRRFTNMVKTPLRFYTAKSYDSIPLASVLYLQFFQAVFLLHFHARKVTLRKLERPAQGVVSSVQLLPMTRSRLCGRQEMCQWEPQQESIEDKSPVQTCWYVDEFFKSLPWRIRRVLLFRVVELSCQKKHHWHEKCFLTKALPEKKHHSRQQSQQKQSAKTCKWLLQTVKKNYLPKTSLASPWLHATFPPQQELIPEPSARTPDRVRVPWYHGVKCRQCFGGSFLVHQLLILEQEFVHLTNMYFFDKHVLLSAGWYSEHSRCWDYLPLSNLSPKQS